MTREPIAIVGLGGGFPGAPTLDDFWKVVEGGIDTASEPPADRWPLDLELAYHPDHARAGDEHRPPATGGTPFAPLVGPPGSSATVHPLGGRSPGGAFTAP